MTGSKGETDSALAAMKKKRDLAMSQLKVHSDYVAQFDPKKSAVESLEIRLEMVEEILMEFKKIHGEIYDHIAAEDVEGIEEATQAYIAFSSEFCCVKGMIKKKTQNTVKSAQESRAPDIVKLPPVPIPEFSGDVKDWVSFRDTFQAVVIDQRISNVVKLHYLRESLKAGEAWKLISEITPSDNAFNVAWETIEKRFDNKNIVVDSHVNELFKMRSISCDNAKDLWRLVEHYGTHLKALETLGEPIEHWDTLIIHMVKFRMDMDSKSLWETKTVSMQNRPTWKDMESFLMERGRVLENLESTKRRSAPFKHNHQPDKKTNSFVANLSSSYKCAYCESSHQTADCKKFAALKFIEKQSVIKKLGLCFRCLVKGHIASTCEKSCELCDGKHHKVIHIEKLKKNERVKKETQEPLKNNANADEVLLMTAKINVMSKDGNWIEARAMLDSGSQSNFINEKLLRKLKIETKPTDTAVSGIVGTTGKLSQKISTNIKSKCSQYQKSIELLVTPSIVEKTPVAKIKISNSCIPEKIVKNLADNSFAEPQEIDMLLGVEVFLEVLQMEQVKAENLTFQGSKFGWIAGGRHHKTLKTPINSC